MPDVRYFGKHRGSVTDNQDPEELGRLKARVPAVLGDTESNWALPSTPYAGNSAGLYCVPLVGANVWIEFEGGDVSYPIWSGCWWEVGQLPIDEGGAAVTPTLKIIRSEQGLQVALDDARQTITVSDTDGSNLITLNVLQGLISIRSKAKVVIEAPLIELAAGAAHPVVYGDVLLDYLNKIVAAFNAHTHPGEMTAGLDPISPAPPQPTLPPAPPSLLSTKVKAG